MPQPPVLVTDIDGTLLDDQGQLPPQNIDSLRRWVDRGYPLVLASGRNLTAALPVITALQRNIYLVLQDGSLVLHYPSLKILAYHNLAHTLAKVSCNLLQVAGFSILVFDSLPHGRQFTLWQNGQLSNGLSGYLQYKKGGYKQSMSLFIGEAPSKVVTIDDQARIEILYQQLHTNQIKARIIKTEAVRLKSWFLEIGPPQASKLKGIETVLNYLGQSITHVIAIGDAQNDLEMIQAAGLGVAVNNASPAIKSSADMVVASNTQGGVAQVINSILR